MQFSAFNWVLVVLSKQIDKPRMHLCRETPVAFDKITSSIEKIDSGEIDECTLDACYFLVSHVGFRGDRV